MIWWNDDVCTFFYFDFDFDFWFETDLLNIFKIPVSSRQSDLHAQDFM